MYKCIHLQMYLHVPACTVSCHQSPDWYLIATRKANEWSACTCTLYMYMYCTLYMYMYTVHVHVLYTYTYSVQYIPAQYIYLYVYTRVHYITYTCINIHTCTCIMYSSMQKRLQAHHDSFANDRVGVVNLCKVISALTPPPHECPDLR